MKSKRKKNSNDNNNSNGDTKYEANDDVKRGLSVVKQQL